MTATLLPVLWAGWILLAAWRRRPAPVVRLRRSPSPSRVPARCRPGALLERLGRPLVGREADAARARRAAGALLAGAAAAPLLPVAAPAAAAAAWWAPAVAERRRAASAEAEVRRSLPEIVDLLALAVGSGLTVPTAVAAVGRRGCGPVATALTGVAEQVAMGRRCADAVDDLPVHLGEPVRPLAAALAASERYGAPLGAALDRLAAELRDDRRRRAEAAARTVPVKLLFPLVLCVLPAFALLTVAPLLAGALGSLRL